MAGMTGSGTNDDDSGHGSIAELAEIVTSGASAASATVTICLVGGRSQSPTKILLAILHEKKKKTLDCAVPVYRESLTVKSMLECQC